MANSDLAAAVASRICHDLVSPVGAVVNGVDLMREMGGAEADAMGMVGQSAARASALLQFYRIAFGAAAEDAQAVGRPALQHLAGVLAQPPRVELEWSTDGPPMPRPEARLIALLALCARSVTGMRGRVRVQAGQHGTLPASVTVQSGALSRTADSLALLEGRAPEGPFSPRDVEFVLAREAADLLGVGLHVERTEGQVTISAA